MDRREKGVEVSTVRVETVRRLHESASRTQAFIEIEWLLKVEAAWDCYGLKVGPPFSRVYDRSQRGN